MLPENLSNCPLSPDDAPKTYPAKIMPIFTLLAVDGFIGISLSVWTFLLTLILMSLVSQELESEWSAASSLQRLKNFIVRFTRNQRKIYQNHVIERYQQFDVRGISERGRQELGIQDIYVQLRVHSTDSYDSDTYQADTSFLDGDYSIWDILALDKVNHIVIIGPPGSGKTTLLQHITLSMCESANPIPISNRPIPIFLFLGSHVITIKANPKISLIELVQESLRRQVYAGKTEWLINQLRKGNCLVLLDGLDEVADSSSRQTVVAWIYDQLNDKLFRNNRFIVTSRSHGYQGNMLPPDLVTVFEVQPFNDEQIRNYIRNWYIEDERLSSNKDRPLEEIHNAVAADIKNLVREVFKTPALHELAANPLLLMMISTVHRYSSKLPKRRADLYEKICEVFLGKLDRLKQHRHPSRATTQEIDDINNLLELNEKRDILEIVAYHMMSHEVNTLHIDDILELIEFRLQQIDPDVDSKQFLNVVEQRGGILMQVDVDTYGFVHLTFQEYLASLHIAKHQLERNFPAWVNSAWWHETLRLYSTHTDIRNVLKAVFSGNPPSALALTLAVECAEEATDTGVAQQVMDILGRWANNVDPKLRKVVGEVKLIVRLNRLNRRDITYDPSQDVYVDQSLITHVEYQLFLDEQRRQQQFHHPEHWIKFEYQLGQGGQGDTPLVGIRPADAKAFCRWLTRWSKSTDSAYRLPKQGEFRNLPIGGSYWVEDSGEFKCTSAGGDVPQLSSQQLYRYLTLDIAPLVSLEVDYTYKLIAELNNQLERSLNEGLDRRAGSIARALNVTLMQFRARAHLVPDLNRYLLTTTKQQLGELLQEIRKHFDTQTLNREHRQQALHRARRLAPPAVDHLKTLRAAALQRAEHTLPDTAVKEVISAALNGDPPYIQLRSKAFPTDHDIAEPFALSIVDDFVGIFELGTDRLSELDVVMTTVFDTYMRHEILKHLSALVKADTFTINPYIDLDRVYQLRDDLQIAYWKVKDLNLTHQKDKDLARELAERLNLARMLADYIFMGLDLSRRSDDLNNCKFGRWTSRVFTLLIVGLLDIDSYQHLYKTTVRRNLTLMLLLQGFTQLYTDQVILDLRTQGKLPPVEGILIVKDKTLRL